MQQRLRLLAYKRDAGGTLRFGSKFNLPGSSELRSIDDRTFLRFDEPAGRHFEGLFFEAAEVDRCIAGGRMETGGRPLDSSTDTSPP